MTTRRPSRLQAALVLLLTAACGRDMLSPPPGGLPRSAAASFAAGSWTAREPIPVNRYESASVGVGGRIYTFGGVTQHVDCTYTKDTRIYDAATNSWTTGAPMPTSRTVMDADVIDGKIYVVGGGTGCGVFTAANEVYTIATNSWTSDTPALAAVYGGSVDAVGGKLYVTGGYIHGNADNRVQEFSPETHTWTLRAPMPTKRGAAASAVFGGKIFVIGGCCSPGSLTAVEVYDPVSNTWEARNAMPSTMNWAMAEVIDGVLYAIGAGPSFQEVYRYDPATDSWTADASLPVPLIFQFGGIASGSLHVIGGISNGEFHRGNYRFTPGVILPPPNVGPVARAGADQILQCVDGAATATLDGSASTDADGSIASFEWTQNGQAIGTGASVTKSFGLGSHTVMLRVTDDDGATGDDDVAVDVRDTHAPTVQLVIGQATLWSPNHRMVLVAAGVGATDACDPLPALAVTVSSNEPANEMGDGDTEDDWNIVMRPDGTFDVYVRAERSGSGTGRVYTISAKSADGTGNTTIATGTVRVPKNGK